MDLLKRPLNTIQVNNYLLVLLSFFITISIYVTDLIVIALVLSWLISGNIVKKYKLIINNRFTLPSIIFFIYFLCSFIWSGSAIINNTTQKQLMLLLLPILFSSEFNRKYIEQAKYAFILGLLGNILLSITTFFIPNNNLFKTGHYSEELFAHAFIDHFDYSIFLCFSIIIMLSFNWKKEKFWQYFLLTIILIIALLNSYGRVGIIAFYIFIPMILLFFFNHRSKYILLFILPIFSIIAYLSFSPLQNRINNTLDSIHLLKSGMSFQEKLEKDAIYISSQNNSLSKNQVINEILKNPEWVNHIIEKTPQYDTSIGKRYIYAKNSMSLIKERLFLGFGANQFKNIYQSRLMKSQDINHPHNNFVFILFELGLIGLILLLMIFYYQLQAFFSFSLKNFLGLIFPLFFMFIMMFDNYFLNHNTLCFFCLFTFIIYSQINNPSLAN